MEAFSALLRGIHRSTVNFLHKKPVTRSFDLFFDLHPNKCLSKQWRCWWFETPSRSLWSHCNVKCRRLHYRIKRKTWNVKPKCLICFQRHAHVYSRTSTEWFWTNNMHDLYGCCAKYMVIYIYLYIYIYIYTCMHTHTHVSITNHFVSRKVESGCCWISCVNFQSKTITYL